MTKKISIAIDAMGGENAPHKTLEGVGYFIKENYKKDDFFINLYGDEKLSAIQLTTASGVCSALKMYLDGKITNQGFTKQESLSWDDFLNNNFGKVYS